MKDIFIKYGPFETVMASGAVGSAINTLGNIYTNSQNIKYQKEANQQMMDFTREMTKAEQDYNSIGAQMFRAMQAGVNPQLLAGSQPTSASSGSTPTLGTPVLNNPFSGNGVAATGSTLANLVMQDRQQKLVSTQLELDELKTQVELVKTVMQATGNQNLSSGEIKDIISAILPEKYRSVNIPQLMQDEYVLNKIQNSIKISNLSVKEKQLITEWIPILNRVQVANINSSTERNKSLVAVDKSILKLNEANRSKIEQETKNLSALWKSLDFQGKLDQQKLLRVVELGNSLVDQIVSDAKISKQDAEYWVWSKLLNVKQSIKIGPFSNSWNPYVKLGASDNPVVSSGDDVSSPDWYSVPD